MTDRSGRSGLHYAALENDVTAIERHLAAGDNPNSADAAGQTPVGLARLIANYPVAEFFEDLD